MEEVKDKIQHADPIIAVADVASPPNGTAAARQ
jgi:hypothetical protein